MPRWSLPRATLLGHPRGTFSAPDRPKTIDFLEGIFGELLALFPGQFIHSGGDEAPKCAGGNARIASKWRALWAMLLFSNCKLSRQSFEPFLIAQSRTMIGWNEMLSHIWIQKWSFNIGWGKRNRWYSKFGLADR